MKRIWADFENNAEQWWDAACNQKDAPEGYLNRIQICGAAGTLELEDDEAERFLSWCQSIPGWSDGPEHAKHPLIIDEI